MKDATLRFYKERMLRVLVHIQQHLDEPLEWEMLAKLAGLSPYHFHHVFTGMLGESLASHVRRLRLERAASRLKLSRASVLQIALEAGYDTHEAFSRAFHSRFDLSPTQYRRSNGAPSRNEVPSGVHYSTDNLRQFRAKGSKSMNVILKQLEPKRVAFMRHVGPYNQVGRIWTRLMTFLGKEGLLGGSPEFIGICYDDPAVTAPSRIRYDACVTVDETFQPQDDIGVQIIPGGDYAMMTHFGPYEDLGDTYTKFLGQWLPRSGRKLRSVPCFESYLNSPENTEPEDLVTDIYTPLETH
jgi:AraC family transcriptional regulator